MTHAANPNWVFDLGQAISLSSVQLQAHFTCSGTVPGDIRMEEWQSDPRFGGAFKLSQPGQDPYVQKMFFDYQKAGQDNDTGVYLAGDCLAWNSGWVEGGLQTALNAAAGVIVSLSGSLNPDKNKKTPLKINPDTYTYI
jgi:tryptophan 2-monooxygenase